MESNILPQILVIDDDPIVLESVVELLESASFAIKGFSSGEAAVELMKESTDSVAVAVVDYRMIGWNGIETIERLRLLKPDLYCILATGYSVPVWQEESDTRPNAVLYKPFDFQTLVAAIEKGLRV